MPIDYYNLTRDGQGLGGLLNYSNNLVDGWMANLFIIAVWITTTYVLSKSEWKMSNVLTFTSLLTFLLCLIGGLFITINGYITFFSSILFVVSLVWSIIDRR